MELYHFTPDGLAEATRHNHTTASDAYSPVESNGSLSLRPSLASNLSSNPIPDDAKCPSQKPILYSEQPERDGKRNILTRSNDSTNASKHTRLGTSPTGRPVSSTTR
ncbi:hypothetical protein BDN70DRAFT_373707 [Pholiota conissans]|uniref:Uncharacterized protein n=1 Tax=Pholiota conissans TaxID=109636 RepID=A0A9P5Z7M6_9AGAR|nr:hypothetical protein BDN70DRAFT_373707 [Pholiota conissans]